jgi:hypothetical protein
MHHAVEPSLGCRQSRPYCRSADQAHDSVRRSPRLRRVVARTRRTWSWSKRFALHRVSKSDSSKAANSASTIHGTKTLHPAEWSFVTTATPSASLHLDTITVRSVTAFFSSQAVLVVQNATRLTVSATRAGFFCPSISIVWPTIIWSDPSCRAWADSSVERSRNRESTATGLRKRILFEP